MPHGVPVTQQACVRSELVPIVLDECGDFVAREERGIAPSGEPDDVRRISQHLTVVQHQHGSRVPRRSAVGGAPAATGRDGNGYGAEERQVRFFLVGDPEAIERPSSFLVVMREKPVHGPSSSPRNESANRVPPMLEAFERAITSEPA
jgi:hypothetical protein